MKSDLTVLPVPAESFLSSAHSGGRGDLQSPHTASGAGDEGEHVRQRVLAIKLNCDDDTYRLVKELGWQAARYRNLFLRARWAEAKQLCVDPVKAVPHDVTKHIRATEKMDLGWCVSSACERESQVAWQCHCRRILAGGPLPESSPNAALTIRGDKRRMESGVQLVETEPDRFVARLRVLSERLADGAMRAEGCWIEVPVALGTAKDWQIDLIRRMSAGEVPILKGALVIKPFRHQVILQLCYPVTIALPRFGNRCATLGPVGQGGRLFLRTECETRDYSGRLHAILDRKEHWGGIRRRVMAQIGRHKGASRTKREVLARMTWADWLKTELHQWTCEIAKWLDSQGIAKLTVMGLGNADWSIFEFTRMLTYKCEALGITLTSEADLADVGTERSVKQEIQRERRKTTKRAGALRTLTASVNAPLANDTTGKG
jgi:hypothetical protein